MKMHFYPKKNQNAHKKIESIIYNLTQKKTLTVENLSFLSFHFGRVS